MHNRMIMRGAWAMILAAALWPLSGAAWAQDQAPPPVAQQPSANAGSETTRLEDIVVTARKIEESAQDVPVSVTAYTGETLEQQNATRLLDVERMTPSLGMREASTNPTGLTISLRGQLNTEILANADPSVGLYVDGVYWARQYGMNSDLLDVQSVQVLRGPQGTLFGRNTTGGAILFQTRNPELDNLSAEVAGRYGRFDERSLSGFVNVPLSDTIALRIAGVTSQRDGTVTDMNTGAEYEDRNSNTFRAKLLIEPNDDFTLVLSAETFRSSFAGPAGGASYAWPSSACVPFTTIPCATAFLPGYEAYIDAVRSTDDVALDTPPHASAETSTYSGTATWNTAVGTLKFIGGYREVESGYAFDLDGSPYPIGYASSASELEQWSGEVQLTGSASDDTLSYALGVLYFEESGTDAARSAFFPGSNPNDSSTNISIDNRSIGAYAQGTWRITPDLGLTAGIRYSEDEKGIERRNMSIVRATGAFVSCQDAGAVGPDCLLSREKTFGGWSYTLGLDYHVADDMLLYAKVSRGFRSGGWNARGASAVVPFQPEVVDEAEVGFKSEFFDGRARLNLAAFYNEVEDMQRTVVSFDPGCSCLSSVIANAAKARFWGGEAELSINPATGLELGATAAIVRPEYVEYRDANGDRSHERFQDITEDQFALWATYSVPVQFAELVFHVDYAWQGDTPVDVYNNRSDPYLADVLKWTARDAHGILNARVSLSENERFEVALFGRNLTNERYRVTNLVIPPSFGVGSIYNVMSDPATYGVEFKATFGQ